MHESNLSKRAAVDVFSATSALLFLCRMRHSRKANVERTTARPPLVRKNSRCCVAGKASEDFAVVVGEPRGAAKHGVVTMRPAPSKLVL